MKAILNNYRVLKAKFDDVIEQMFMLADENDADFPKFEKTLLDDADMVRNVKCNFEAKVETFYRKLAGEQARQYFV